MIPDKDTTFDTNLSGGMMGRFSRPLTSMRAVSELRGVIEGFAARTAARRIADGADKRPLLEAFARLVRTAAEDDVAGEIAADRDLHLLMIRTADVEGLEKAWEVVAGSMDWFRIETTRICWPDLTLHAEAHRALVDAVCAGDSNASEAAAISHMEAVWYRLADHAGDASLPDDPLSRASAYIELHLHEQVQLDFLAQYIARTSAGHLSRLFRVRYGVSYSKYLRELRMRKAAKLLSDTLLPIRRVAAIVGYQDPSRFAQHFRRRFQALPNAYRDQHGSGS